MWRASSFHHFDSGEGSDDSSTSAHSAAVVMAESHVLPSTNDEKKAKKKKRSTQFQIFDALQAKSKSNSVPAPVLSQSKPLHSNAARWNEVLAPKTFLVKKKKKKGLSVFKKKILMVGLIRELSIDSWVCGL